MQQPVYHVVVQPFGVTPSDGHSCSKGAKREWSGIRVAGRQRGSPVIGALGKVVSQVNPGQFADLSESRTLGEFNSAGARLGIMLVISGDVHFLLVARSLADRMCWLHLPRERLHYVTIDNDGAPNLPLSIAVRRWFPLNLAKCALNFAQDAVNRQFLR